MVSSEDAAKLLVENTFDLLPEKNKNKNKMVIRVETLMHKKGFMLSPNRETWRYGILPIQFVTYSKQQQQWQMQGIA